MQNKRNFKTVLFLLLVSGGALALLGLFTKEDQLKRIAFALATGLGLAALIQCVLFAVNPKLFKDKHRPY